MSDAPGSRWVEIVEADQRHLSICSSIALLEEPVLVGLEDHFTLPVASNLIRFRSRKNAARVYETKNVQIVLEETYDEETDTRKISVKRLTDESFGVSFLRLLYTIVCCLFTGFFFVFCLQVLLFLVLDFAVESGATTINTEINVVKTIGVVMAIAVFVHAFSEALVIAGHFIADIWTGHFLARQFMFKRLKVVAVEWIFFVAFLLLPLLVMCGSLWTDTGNWWSNTAIVWFGCVMCIFVVFCFNIVFYEVKAAYEFCNNLMNSDSEKFMEVVKRCIFLKQRHKYSGRLRSVFLARSYFTETEDTENPEKSKIFEETRVVTKSWWATLSNKLPDWMFKTLDEPYRLYTLEDVQDYRPFLTKDTWGLEKIFCRPRNSRYIAIVEGPGALTQSQLRSSLLCSLVGTALIILVVISFLVWFQIPGAFVAILFFISLVFSWNALVNTRNLFKIGKDIVDVKRGKIKANDDENEETECAEPVKKKDINSSAEETWHENPEGANKSNFSPRVESRRFWDKVGAKPSEAVYLVSEYTRVNEASCAFCWLMMRFEVAIVYIYPLITLFLINFNLAVLFFICATISGIRHYINITAVIEETGNMDLVGGDTEKAKWKNKSRLNNIVGHVTAGKSRNVWVSILGCCGLTVLALFLGAIGASTENTNTDTFTYLPNFYYRPLTDDMRYPTCTLSNMNGGFGENSTLADYAYLSSIAYQKNSQPSVNSWFGPAGIEVIEETDYVEQFRKLEDPNNLAVFFKMFSFPQRQFAMIVIRGTSNNWDTVSGME